EVVAALLDGDQSGYLDVARLRVGVQELVVLDVDEVDRRVAAPFRANRVEQLGQAHDGVGAEDEVGVRDRAQERLAALRGHTAANCDHHVALALLEPAQRAGRGQHLVFAVLADGARVDDDQVGLLARIGEPVALLAQHLDHAMNVVVVHLTAEILQIEQPFTHRPTKPSRKAGEGQEVETSYNTNESTTRLSEARLYTTSMRSQ